MQEPELTPAQYAVAVAALADEELQQQAVRGKLHASEAWQAAAEEDAMEPVGDMRALIDRDAYKQVRSSCLAVTEAWQTAAI